MNVFAIFPDIFSFLFNKEYNWDSKQFVANRFLWERVIVRCRNKFDISLKCLGRGGYGNHDMTLGNIMNVVA